MDIWKCTNQYWGWVRGQVRRDPLSCQFEALEKKRNQIIFCYRTCLNILHGNCLNILTSSVGDPWHFIWIRGSITFYPDPQIRISDSRIRIQLQIRLLSSVTLRMPKNYFSNYFSYITRHIIFCGGALLPVLLGQGGDRRLRRGACQSPRQDSGGLC